MAVGKLNLLVLAAAAAGVLWVEHGQRIRIETPAPAELAAPGAALCPENESVPFSTDCMAFIQSGIGSGVRARADAAADALPESPESP